MEITNDELWPRDLRHRYRIYFLKDGELEVLCATPTPGGIGAAIVAIHDDMQREGLAIGDLGRLGVMDTCPNEEPSETGTWIIVPHDRGDHL